MSLKTAIPFIGAALAIGVAEWATAGTATAPIIMMAGSLGLSAGLFLDTVLFRPKLTTNAPLFQFATAQVGANVPVVFGTTQLAGNYTCFDTNLVTQKNAYAKSGGKGSLFGPPKQVVGFIYGGPLEYGLCMGPIDGIGNVTSSPNQALVRNLKDIISGTGHISATSGDNMIYGSGTNFTGQLKQNGLVIVGTSDTTLNETASGYGSFPGYTIKSIISNTQIEIYEQIGAGFSGTVFVFENAILNFTGFSGDYQNLSLSGKQNEGGTVRVYQGNSTQTRISANDPWGSGSQVLNYRNMCYAVFLNGYTYGQQPTAKTYLFEVQRMPKCVDASNTIISGLITTGSTDPTNINYQDANPAAIVWEVLTNPIWGLGRNPNELDQASFIQASAALAAANIGMSFSMNSDQTLSDIINTIKNHCSLQVYHDGIKIKCWWMYDTTGDSYTVQAILNKSSLVKFKHSRASWGSQTNEVRSQFTNRLNAYQSELATEQDLASITASGAIKSQRLNMSGFSNPDVAQRMTQRFLRETSYPQATVGFTMNRWSSFLRQGALIQINWDEWTTDVVATFWRIISVEHMEDEEGGIQVTAMEDMAYMPTTDDPPTLTTPTFPYNYMGVVGNVDWNSAPQPSKVVNIEPVGAMEANCFLSPQDPQAIFLCEQRAGNVTGAQIAWSDLAANNFTTLGTISAFAVTGTLVNAYALTKAFDRSIGMLVSLNNTDDAGTILGANLVRSNLDSFESLIADANSMILVDQEIMQVGLAYQPTGTSIDSFTVPAISSNVSTRITVPGMDWIVPGMYINIATAGQYLVISRSNPYVTIQNTGATGNATASTVIMNPQSVTTNSIILTNIARGCCGTPIQNHAPGATFWYIPTLTSDYVQPLTGMDSEAFAGTPQVEFQVIAIVGNASAGQPIQVFVNPDETVKYLANRPFSPGLCVNPSIVSGTPGSTNFTVDFSLRPRCMLIGSGVDDFTIGLARTGSPIDPTTEFRVQQFDSSGAQIGTGYAVLTAYQTIVNSDPNNDSSGLIQVMGYVCSSNATTLKIYSAMNGWQAIEPLTIPLV